MKRFLCILSLVLLFLEADGRTAAFPYGAEAAPSGQNGIPSGQNGIPSGQNVIPSGQNITPPVKKSKETKNGGMTVGNRSNSGGRMNGGISGSGRLMGTTTKEMGFGSLPVDVGAYDDKKMKALEKKFEDRKWEDEGQAWEAAQGLNTLEAYQKYLARFPGGAHVPQATKRVTDLTVNDIFKGSHNTLPKMERTDPDDDSQTSTIVIENATGMMLTVMFSGEDSRTVTIAPDSVGSVTIQNGSYRIAASVPSPSIHSFAGTSSFAGGRYSTGFCIVRGGMRF